MSAPTLAGFARNELKYQLRREVSKEIRNHCPKGDPMAAGITVMLGSVLAMAVLNQMLFGNTEDRSR
jgi:hypothetical protein